MFTLLVNLIYRVRKIMGFSHVQLLRQETPDFKSTGLRSGLSCSVVSSVYQRQIDSVNELKGRLIDVWCCLEQSIFDEAIDQWRGRLRACVHAKGAHFKYSL